jgi:hypothetical protein
MEEPKMTIKEFELQMRMLEKDVKDSLERRTRQEGDWGRAYLLREVERWQKFSD